MSKDVDEVLTDFDTNAATPAGLRPEVKTNAYKRLKTLNL